MPSIAERLKNNSKLALGVRQHRAVLDFTTALEDEMDRRDLSQSQLATMLHKSRAWISKVFRRKPNLTFFTAVEMADALDLDFHIDLVPRRTASGVLFSASFQISNLEPANTPAESLPEAATKPASLYA